MYKNYWKDLFKRKISFAFFQDQMEADHKCGTRTAGRDGKLRRSAESFPGRQSLRPGRHARDRTGRVTALRCAARKPQRSTTAGSSSSGGGSTRRRRPSPVPSRRRRVLRRDVPSGAVLQSGRDAPEQTGASAAAAGVPLSSSPAERLIRKEQSSVQQHCTTRIKLHTYTVQVLYCRSR